jgi:bla regulator protein BlaR1
MLMYLLKSGVLLTIFYGFYKLLLENESIHAFKRYYLLVSVVLAFFIPFITFTEYIEAPSQNVPIVFSDSPITNTFNEDQPKNFLPFILWTIYGMGVLLFSIKFFKNLSQLLYKIRNNTKVKIDPITHVLLQDLVVPHTFFNYIFLNKQKFETQQIPKEVLLHEETHAKQKHSLDVLFIELMQILFWFNPLIYFIKHSIKLNHEFLADNAVLKQGIASSTYQNTLLAFSSNAAEPKLANAINYSSIKKRFTVMKTHTSKQAFWLRNLILLPLLAILIYSFSEKRVIEKPQGFQKVNNEIKVLISKDNKVIIGNETIDFNSISDKLIELTKNEKIKPMVFIHIEGHVGTAYLADITSEVKKSHLNISNITAKSIDLNETDEQYKIFANYYEFTLSADSIVYKNKKGELITGTSGSQSITDTSKASDTNEEFDLITLKLPKSRGRYLNSNDLGKLNDFVKETFYEKNQKKATPEEIEEFNKIIKKLKAQPEKERIIKQRDLNFIENIYAKMTEEQKAKAEAFPDLLPPPPPPVPSDTNDHSKESLEARRKFDEKAKIYGDAMSVYFKEKNGNLNDLKKQYNEVMVLYNSYYKLLEKENLVPTPPSAKN